MLCRRRRTDCRLSNQALDLFRCIVRKQRVIQIFLNLQQLHGDRQDGCFEHALSAFTSATLLLP